MAGTVKMLVYIRKNIFPIGKRNSCQFRAKLKSVFQSASPYCISFYFQAQAEERAAMLRAQLEQRKKAILERINKEGKDKLEKVCNKTFSSQNQESSSDQLISQG